MEGRDISASRRPERLAKESLRPYGGNQNPEIILPRHPFPHYLQSNLAAYTGCQVEVELLSGLYFPP